jgi:hypothetical protein
MSFRNWTLNIFIFLFVMSGFFINIKIIGQMQNLIINPGFEIEADGGLASGFRANCDENDNRENVQACWDEILGWSSSISNPNSDSATFNKKKPKNSIELELLGKGVFYSLSYARELISVNNVGARLGVGYFYNRASFHHKHSLPIYAELFYKFRSIEFVGGGGLTMFYNHNGTNLSRADFWVENPESYRRGSESIFWGFYYPKFGLEYFTFAGLNYVTQQNYYVGINYYYAYLFNTFYDDDFLIRHYLGIKIGKKL